MFASSHIAIRTLLLGSLVFFAISCAKTEEDSPDGNGNPLPTNFAHITGTVRDASGAPLVGAALHVIYGLPPVAPAAAAQPADVPTVAFFYTEEPLFTTCNGNVPLPEGIMVKIFWDVDSDGFDETDPHPPLCRTPPDCPGGPNQTVNMIEFPINWSSAGMTPGTFYMDRGFFTAGSTLIPNRYYLRIFCTDGRALYTSQLLDLPGGPGEYRITFTCDPCGSQPEIPQWVYDPPWPNPMVDTFTVHFGLEQSAITQLTLRATWSSRVDTFINQWQGSGGYLRGFRRYNLPNGLYDLWLYTGTHSEHYPLLVNRPAEDILPGLPGAVNSGAQGVFAFDAAAGEQLLRRGMNNEPLSPATLNTLTVKGTHALYGVADTTFAVAAGDTVRLNLTLHP